MLYKQAHEIAIKLYKSIEPFCEKIDIAGSVRREKAEVKDIEICCVPRTTKETNLFGEAISDFRLPAFCSTVLESGLVIKGDIKKGRYVQLQLKEPIVLDLFIPEKTDYYRQLAIRTGSADYSFKVIANAWLKNGWCGTENGLRKTSECFKKFIGQVAGRDKFKWICNSDKPALPPEWENEYEFFKWLNLEWVEPKKRV